MRIFFSILLILLLLSCKRETVTKKHTLTETVVNETEIYEVINNISKLRNDSTKTNYLTENISSLKEIELLSLNKLDTILSKEDLEFIKVQNSKRGKFRLNKQLTENPIIPFDLLKQMKDDRTEKTNLWERFAKKYHENGLLSISLPLFSKNKEIAIVTTSYICATCINRETSIYRKINGKWESFMVLYVMRT